jgi:hypothetical protein
VCYSGGNAKKLPYTMKAGEKYAMDSFGTPNSINLRVVAASVTAKPT